MKVLVGLSGGADSAAVALSLLEAGEDVSCVFLRLFEGADPSAAEFVAQKLGVPLEIVDAVEEFRACVIADFVGEYARGRTPNPCALCNRETKIRLLCEAATRLGCDAVATGHYADVSSSDGRLFVTAGTDKTRDQSYFLWRLTQTQLGMLRFVLADEEKAKLSERVSALLPPGTKESREVCFIPADDRVAFLEGLLPDEAKRKGEFVDCEGRVLARHDGIFRYTVGQRRGFGVGFGRRVYVKEIDAESARVVLCDRDECLTDSCRLSQMNFQKMSAADGTYDILCRVRYRAPLVPAELTLENGEGRVRLKGGARAVFAPGQSLVCYDSQENVLCGGVIEPAQRKK